MSRALIVTGPMIPCFPRPRGDEPALTNDSMIWPAFSPPARG